MVITRLGSRNMTDLKEIVDALLASDSTWPITTANIYTCFETKGFTSWYGRWFHPRWLAQLVVVLVEQRAKPLAKKQYPDAGWSDLPDEIGTVSYAAKEKFVRLALRDFNLIEERYAELKRRLGSSLQKE